MDHYSFFPTIIKGFSDVNCISDSKGTKSISVYVFTLYGGAVCWKSVKQTIIIGFIMETELVTLDTLIQKMSGFKKF